ncbi:hypothetical protein C6500_03225 [Candidatus Poribacteria bacterium]|nr:MAG: hypothetical protein C6500_03225 [Candidatus Poribacteria bacterium]
MEVVYSGNESTNKRKGVNPMKKNLRRKIHTFLQSEEGKTGVKAPLALAVASGSFLLTQIMFTPPVSASDNCTLVCDEGEVCIVWCAKKNQGGTCIDLRSECVAL